ncbi:YidC/Oxa1 family membrane protein insertase [Dehalococcoides mccartyi]|uniref:YidC/Oxa1 family membrane protein insertase n=1 Tax=Dehalococcoides mccartyi TaxID=61435 RepID=UPI0003C815D0|nr:YidC/Oxa1 family membrane protein insertase [Dehalococcoides mccartyi]AHB13699.1 preprotein translocase subunit YidC [Dehalococcoides mccartyi GY50]AII58701.1 membrane protein [Dehalococcoides mccartyi CG1]APH12619.1 hypothetical protein ASJ33_05370 [Dehalococcoides mccartyi]
MDIGAIWDLVILSPMINGMVWLSHNLWGSFGLTVIVLTVVIRLALWPLNRKQLTATKKMQEITVHMEALKKKHGNDRQKLAEEQMKLYKESGVSPTGCLVPMLIQFPIWIALYQAIVRVLAVTPEDFMNLADHLYSWPVVYQTLPLSNHFLWMDLSLPDFALALLVGVSMYVQQKMSTPKAINQQQAAQGQMMSFMMPFMFFFFSLSFPSGLAFYWFVSAIVGIIMQYFITGWGQLEPMAEKVISYFRGGRQVRSGNTYKTEKRTATPSGQLIDSSAKGKQMEGSIDEKGRDERQDGGGSNKTGAKSAKRKPRRS